MTKAELADRFAKNSPRVAVPSRVRRKGRKNRRFPPIHGLLPLVLFLAVWQVVGSSSSPFYPVPSTWPEGVIDLWMNGELPSAIIATLTTFSLGLIGATLLGAILGVIVGASRIAHRAMNPTLEFFRAVPAAAVVPIGILLIGYDQTMKVSVVIFATVWPVLLNSVSAIRTLNPVLLDTAATFRLSRSDRIRKIVVPSLMPAVLLGVRQAAPITLIVALLVEILTFVSGVGGLIALAQRSFEASTVFGLVIVTGIFGFIVNALVAVLESIILKYRPRHGN